MGATGALSSATSVLGSYQICHNVCLGIIAALSIVGISVAGMPLMFLTRVSVHFWIAGVAMLLLMIYLWQYRQMKFSKNLLLVNSGLLIAGVPFTVLSSFQKLFWVAGGFVVSAGVFLFVSERYARNKKKSLKRNSANNIMNVVLVAGCLLVLGIFIFNMVTFSQIKSLQQTAAPVQPMNMMGQPMSRMSFSGFDKEQAREFMDKNTDGFCDACGMPIDQCIASGMMQCSMDKNAKIGLLGSQHIHADWKIYSDGKPVDLTSYSHMQRMREGKSVSSFIHVDSGALLPEKTGDVLHMHATGVPLSVFLESLGSTFGNKKLKFFVNGKENKDWKNYVFKDVDKMLLTDGKGNIDEQLKSITRFASIH